MDQLTRRRFLGWTSAGAAGAGLLAVVPRLGVSMPGSGQRPAQSMPAENGAMMPNAALALPTTADPIVAYIHNAASGELSLMVGTREMTIHDPDLVARLFQRAGSAS
ncbi:MAG: hypothetical protein JO247_06370 [Chloroflexi bacterium]|nr:hypothetical protein [Chloroflexota bacterium]